MEKVNVTSNGGISFLGLLQIIFIVLKILDKVKWNWFIGFPCVFLPTYISLGILLIVVIVFLVLVNLTKK